MPSIAGHNVGKDNVRQSSPFESSSKSCGPFDQFRADDFHKEETFVEQGFDDGPCKSADRLSANWNVRVRKKSKWEKGIIFLRVAFSFSFLGHAQSFFSHSKGTTGLLAIYGGLFMMHPKTDGNIVEQRPQF